MLLLGNPANADEDSTRAELRTEGQLQFAKGDVLEIERTADQYRKTGQRTPAGFWALYSFYDGMTAVNPDAPNDPNWDVAERKALSWHQKNPQSATAIIVYARLLNRRGWAYRGDGYANTLTAGGKKKFDEYLKRAAGFLDDNREVGMQDPTWYSERISIANAEGAPKEELFRLALQGLDKYPTYYQIHFVMANALLPKWGGNFGLIKRYATLAVAHSQMAGEGTQAYARFYFSVSLSSQDKSGNVYVPDVDWLLLKQSLDEIYSAYPDPWTLNLMRAMGCTFGSNVDCKRYLEQLSKKYISVGWYDTPKWQKDCEDWALRGKSFNKPVEAVPQLGYAKIYPLILLFIAMAAALMDIRNRRLKRERIAAARKPSDN